MVKYVFLGLFLPLYLVFTYLAVNFKSFKIYWTGALVSGIYFLGFSEGIVYAFCKKIPLIGFLLNPYQGDYKLLLLNYQYNYIFFWMVGILIIAGAVYLLIKNKKQEKAFTDIPPQA